jgi:1-acyl-sn-glycerol-3-phosphate acyltransferase
VVHPLQTPESFRDKSVAQLRDEMHNMISSALPYRQAEAAEAAKKEA